MRWTALLLVLIVAACARGAERPEPRSDEHRPVQAESFDSDDHRAWLELYDEAGFPDVSGLRRVEFEARRSRNANDEITIEFERAWVLSTSPLVLLRDSLWTEPEDAEVPEYMQCDDPEAPDEPPRERVYRDVDFADELRTQLEAAETDDEYYPIGMDGRVGPLATYWLVRARWAEMRGLPDLSRRALVQVERSASRGCGQEDCTPEAAIRNGFQLKLLWQATDGAAGFMPRPQARELVVRARAIAPDGEHTAHAIELLDRLDRTIATDTTDVQWPDGGDPEQVQRLIYLLREQKGFHMGLVNSCKPPYGRFGPIRSPAREIQALGREVIPVLIEHIDDDTLTRTLRYHRDYYFGHQIATVGDVAVEIIEGIASRTFRVPQESHLYKTPEEVEATQKLVREWWADVDDLSQRQQLLHDLANADESQSNWIADHLLQQHGMEIWPELIRAFRETKDDDARRSLLYAMAQGPADDPEAINRFLVAALDDRSADVRIAAADILTDRGRHDATETIIRDLDQHHLNPQAWGQNDRYEKYFALLAADGSAEAVDAIDRAVQRRGHGALIALGSGGCEWPDDDCKPELDAAAKARLLDTLAEYLDDFGELEVTRGPGRQRTCDLAAAAYTALTGRDELGFASLATSIERDRVSLDMLNAHRAQHGRAPVSWPHVAPLQGKPGRDHVQRVHLVGADVHEAAALEWLASFAERDLNPREITTALVELAERYSDVPFSLRILRFPDDAGVILTLDVGAPTSHSLGSIESAVYCGGVDCGGVANSGYVSIGRLEPASEVFADFLHERFDVAWNKAPIRIEEYVFAVKVSPVESKLRCQCTDVEDSDWLWLLLIAGLFASVRAYQSSAMPSSRATSMRRA